eukprot:TRINITY_DN5908_c0_g1_i1.p1 TRINITY_DN5908_c0_g1~~TRINITY_DN5908_c0_g1_i1.p1  ORF type:complete len:620 (-),score=141.82 TRINITY_DN5908_c0_g1_i1:50-1792(-)
MEKEMLMESNPALRPTKLFIGGITRGTTTEQLRDHFSCYGRVLDCVAMRQSDGRSRGFGYVTLDSPQSADCVLATPQVLNGRVVDVKRAVPEGNMNMAPTTRLHTPGSAAVSTPLFSTGATPGTPLSAPMSPSSLDLAASCSYLGMPGVVSPFWPLAYGCGSYGVPDCVDLLSVGRTTPQSAVQSSAVLSTQPLQAQPSQMDAGLPETPTGASGGSLSADAAEFRPSTRGAAASKSKTRTALGEITNTLVENAEGKDDADKEHLSKSSEGEQLSAGNQRKKALQIDTDIFEDCQAGLLSSAGLDLPEVQPGPLAKSSPSSEPGGEAQSLPSLGSAGHEDGTCKRCNFFAKGRCQNGESCMFCHFSHEKMKPSRQAKRERQAKIQKENSAIFDGVTHVYPEPEAEEIMAYPMFPGMPAMQTTKLPSLLALPGNYFSCYSSSPAPPPGLLLQDESQAASAVPWQPDEEVSPLSVSPQANMPVLSTTPVSPGAFTDSSAKKMMATMSTQTEALDKAVLDVDATTSSLSREFLLKFRTTVDASDTGIRAEARRRLGSVNRELCEDLRRNTFKGAELELKLHCMH